MRLVLSELEKLFLTLLNFWRQLFVLQEWDLEITRVLTHLGRWKRFWGNYILLLIWCCMRNKYPKILIASLHRSVKLIPQTFTWTSFRAPIAAILHFVRFGFSSKKRERVLNISTRFSMDCASFQKTLDHLHMQYKSIKEAVLEYLYTFYFGMFFNKKK